MIAKTGLAQPIDLDLLYPSSDAPMVESSDQYDWLTLIKAGLEALFKERKDVVVAGDMMWYPVEHEPHICVAPDVFVAFGPEKKSRKSYRQFVEGVAPQVAFGMLSAGNSTDAIARKLGFYDRYGVEEYYTYDPADHVFRIWMREPGGLREQFSDGVWHSPLLGVRFEWTPGREMRLFRADGRQILDYVQVFESLEQTEVRLELTEEKLDQTVQRVEQLEEELDAERRARRQVEEELARLRAELRNRPLPPSDPERRDP